MIRSQEFTGVLFVVSLAAFGVLAFGQNQRGRKMVRGELSIRIDLKQALSNGTSNEVGRALLAKIGYRRENLSEEKCALYVKRRLTIGELTVLSAQGVDLHETWVPPVEGKHPHGFYLATVSHESFKLIERDQRFVRVESTERLFSTQNDLGRSVINADDVNSGLGVSARDGSGVKIAILDTGVDLTSTDFPTPVEAFDVTDGVGLANWSTNVANTTSGHGTHVTGSAVGNGGHSGGLYQGVAPGADFYFYKIAEDSFGGIFCDDIIEALTRAAFVGCDVISLSIAGYTEFIDGSDPICQAVDVAVAAGSSVFISAGNQGDKEHHASAAAAPATTSAPVGYLVDNSAGPSTLTTSDFFRVIWRDDIPGDFNISLSVANLGPGESITLFTSNSSVRGTESRFYRLTKNLAAGATKTYQFEYVNSATSGTTPLVHSYWFAGDGIFSAADPAYTVQAPALADDAIAVGALHHRAAWTDYQGNGQTASSGVLGDLANFSSKGPRIDGLMALDLLGPGSASISIRDIPFHSNDAATIDDDGATLDGSGPANYYALSGTSMATPQVAGVAALVLEADPTLSPAQLKSVLTSTAANAASPDSSRGHGLVDALAAVLSLEQPPGITSITPMSAPAGMSSVTVTVTGSNFTADSVVHWDGILQTTTFTSSSILGTSIPGSLLSSAGTAVVTVVTAPPGGGISNGEVFTIGVCASMIAAFPWTEDFDSLPGNGGTAPPLIWEQDQADGGGTGSNAEWVFRSGDTPTIGTGPASDHSTGVAGQGVFAHVEDDGDHPAVILWTPCLDLSALSNPIMRFWIHSNNGAVLPTMSENTLHVDVLDLVAGVLVSDVVTPIGHRGDGWVEQIVDLAPFAGLAVQIGFRGTSDGGSRLHDIALDDVVVFEGLPAGGQAPQLGFAILDIEDALNPNGLGVGSGGNGPYDATTTTIQPLDISIVGVPNQAILLLMGPLNVGSAVFNPQGQLDCGTAIVSGTGVPGGLSIVADGNAPGFLNSLFNLSSNGTFDFSFSIPASLSGFHSCFQAVVFNGQASVVSISNAVDLLIF
ncbi:MAG: S8 family serine peptidase [Planctomycetota bacterium]